MCSLHTRILRNFNGRVSRKPGRIRNVSGEKKKHGAQNRTGVR